jgi:predicted enzyme related to lactoylglutathione lyase
MRLVHKFHQEMHLSFLLLSNVVHYLYYNGSVSSVDEYTAKIEAAGGKIIQPKTPILGIGYTLVFKDTESNPIGLFEENKDAK